jgi:tetratricopeptide (TPR) repeat protein
MTRNLTIVAAAFALGLAVFAATRTSAPAPATAAAPVDEPALAAQYLQKLRETGDLSYATRAEALLRRHPDDAGAVADLGTLAASRHDFRTALRLARRARALAPGTLTAYPLLVDALVELGRFRAAERTARWFTSLRPSLPAYARISYLRELHGDLRGAASAMQLAISAGASAPENVAAVQVLHGELSRQLGRERVAARDYATALAGVPGYAPALAGRARLAAARGKLGRAIAIMRRVVARLPLPEHVVTLGELQLAAGRAAAARRTFALLAAERRLLAAAKVDTDAETAVYEADHGSPRRAVALARRAWAAAPGIRAADALGSALTRSGRPREGLMWARRALRLGSLDPLLRCHAGIAAVREGRRDAALTARRSGRRDAALTARRGGRRDLRLALAHGLAAHPWQAAQAREALR